MAKYAIEDTTLTGIADAIREKTGGTEEIAVSSMAAEIGAIETGGGVEYEEVSVSGTSGTIYYSLERVTSVKVGMKQYQQSGQGIYAIDNNTFYQYAGSYNYTRYVEWNNGVSVFYYTNSPTGSSSNKFSMAGTLIGMLVNDPDEPAIST